MSKANYKFSNKEFKLMSLSDEYGLRIFGVRDDKGQLGIGITYKGEKVYLDINIKPNELGYYAIEAHKKYYTMIYKTGSIIKKKEVKEINNINPLKNHQNELL